MTEDEARAWLVDRLGVSRETMDRLQGYIDLLLGEMAQQNLIAESTRDSVWARHIVDSAQLLLHSPQPSGEWMDLGSGAGLPGIVIAIVSDWSVVMVESRAKRIAFLNQCIETLGLKAEVHGGRLETMPSRPPAKVISARAFAPLPRLLDGAARFADIDSFWLLPKGRSWQSEVQEAQRDWKGVFHVEQSLTSTDSAILKLSSLARKSKRA